MQSWTLVPVVSVMLLSQQVLVLGVHTGAQEGTDFLLFWEVSQSDLGDLSCLAEVLLTYLSAPRSTGRKKRVTVQHRRSSASD